MAEGLVADIAGYYHLGLKIEEGKPNIPQSVAQVEKKR